MNKIFEMAQELKESTIELRRDFHRHPELGLETIRTAAIVAKELRNLSMEVSTGMAKTGVVGLLEGSKPGPVVLVRFDMDALPVQEENNIDYASEVPGKMHACGHDGHVAIGLTVAKILTEMRSDLRGTVKFVFQPGEEGARGAEKMVQEGVLENPKPDFAVAMHLWNEKPKDWVVISPGPLMAGADFIDIIVTGKGGHGALPQQTADPVIAASLIINAVQTIVSRNISPLDGAVISITSVKAGEAYNVIPQTAVLKGTIRTFKKEVRQIVCDRLQVIVEEISKACGCTGELKVTQLTPSVVNNPKVTEIIQRVAEKDFPELKIEKNLATMVSEDMAYFLDQVPGCFILVGSANPEKGLIYSHHHPKFNFDEEALTTGAALIASSVVELLNQ
jgi:amidohydrolase